MSFYFFKKTYCLFDLSFKGLAVVSFKFFTYVYKDQCTRL